jgi:hypothetical protein
MKRINKNIGIPVFNLNMNNNLNQMDNENSLIITPIFIINEMDKIIDGLWLGGAISEQGLIDNKFTHVLSIIDKKPEHIDSNYFQTKWVNIEDNGNEPIDKYFDECNEFIHQGLVSGGKIYVHCQKGFSRSPSIIIAYLMKYNKFNTFDDACQYVASKRPTICPNLGFLIALHTYSKKLMHVQ